MLGYPNALVGRYRSSLKSTLRSPTCPRRSPTGFASPPAAVSGSVRVLFRNIGSRDRAGTRPEHCLIVAAIGQERSYAGGPDHRQCLRDMRLGPLRRAGPERAGDTPPLGAVLVPPEDGLDRLPQVVVRHLAVRAGPRRSAAPAPPTARLSERECQGSPSSTPVRNIPQGLTGPRC